MASERVDVERFREAAQRGLHASARADAAAALTELDHALSRWPGQPFPELSDTGQRTRLVALRRGPAMARLECCRPGRGPGSGRRS